MRTADYGNLFVGRREPQNLITAIGRKFLSECYERERLVLQELLYVSEIARNSDEVDYDENLGDILSMSPKTKFWEEKLRQKEFLQGFSDYIFNRTIDLEVPVDSLLPLMYSVIYMAGTGISSTPYGVRMPSRRLDPNGGGVDLHCKKVIGRDPWAWFDEIKEELRYRRFIKIIEDSRENDGRISLNKLDLMHQELSEPFDGVYQEAIGSRKKLAYLLLGKEIASQLKW